MSYRTEKSSLFQGHPYSPADVFMSDMSLEDVKSLFLEVLNNGIHGICFSLYEDGQKPGDTISDDQITRRIKILKPYVKWIRTFSTTEGNELIPVIACEHGLRTMVGAWLGNDKEKNELELENLVQLCQDGFVDIAAVGNEVLYRNDLSIEDLMESIKYVKSQVPDIQVGYVDAYYEFGRHPQLVDVCDVVLANYYPFWEGTHFQDSLDHLHHMHQQTVAAANGKKIIVTETGWPSRGENIKSAFPDPIFAIKYFINAQLN